MKKIILSLVCAISIFSLTAQQANALIVFDPTNFATNVKTWIVDTFQLAKDTITAAATPVTATQQTLETVNNKILIPMRDAMTIILIMKSGDNMKNLVLGSLGTQPLLIKNPGAYYKERALGAIGVDLSLMNKQNGVYGNSVLSSLINSTRYNYSSASTKLSAINRSAIPSSVQKKVCDDAVLTRLAREDVQASVKDGTLDESAYGDRRRELYRALCTGDPDTNPALAATLHKLALDRPEIGGWDTWLALTSGDNPYNKTVQSQLVINQRAQEAEMLAKMEYTIGGGIRNLTECKKYTEEDLNGNLMGETSTPGCVLEDIKQAASTINTAYAEAINAPIKLLQNTLGPGAGNLVNTAFTSINLIRSISSAMDAVSGGSSGSGGGAMTNTSNVTVSSSVPVNDLANNSATKETLTSPMKKQLRFHQKSIASLESTDRNFLALIDSYDEKLNSMNRCYGILIDDYPGTKEYPEVIAAGKFTTAAFDANKALRTRLTKEIELIAVTKTLITDTLNTASSSNSSEHLLSVFNSYQNKVDSEELPNFDTAPMREGEYSSFKIELEQSVGEGGTFYTHNNNCGTVRHRMEGANTSIGY